MACGRGIEDDEVGDLRGLERFDPTQHQQISNARGSRGHHIDGAGGHQAPGDASQAMVGQILGQSLVRGYQTASYIGIAAGSTAGVKGLFKAREFRGGKQSADRSTRGETDQQGGDSGPSGGPGQGCGHGAFAHASLPGHDEDP